MTYFVYFLFSAALALLLTPAVKRLAFMLGCVDVPNVPRKIHSRPMPLLGGLAVFTAMVISVLVYLQLSAVDFNVVPLKFFAAIFLGGLILMVGGMLDDRFNLPAKLSVLFPALASLAIVWFGIGVGIRFLTNPFGGYINLDFLIAGIPASAVFVWLWVMGMTYTTKLLDGLDGLASGIALIGGLTMFALSLTEHISQPITATLAIIFSGALVGYLVYAFNPASIFLGESGSTFLGFFLGVLSVLTGAKIATALLVMGIPILDVVWAIVRRIVAKRSPFSADRKHLHFRLLDIGFSQRQAVLVLYGISVIFGFSAIFLQSMGKLIALGLLFFVMVGLVLLLVSVYKRRQAGSAKIDISPGN